MRTLYPALEPYECHELAAGQHRIYVEECGNPEGLPVLFLHGGPGSGCKAEHRRVFDPTFYRIILTDQRGAGRSQPQGELRHNTTQALLQDLERIRRELRIGRWLVLGGSWGAALALLYAQQHPQRVLGLILRGTFLARKVDLEWFIRDGAPRIYPEQWFRLVEGIAKPDRDDLLGAIAQRLNGPDELAQRRMAREWALWTSRVALGDDFDPEALNDHVPMHVLNQTRIELHYAVHHYFIVEGQTLAHCDRLRDMPVVLIHGQRDLVCPPEQAFTLYRRLPHAELRLLPTAGHIAAGVEMIDALVSATDEMRTRLARGV